MIGMMELDAKVKYTQHCRSLKTYGITFFLVKVSHPGLSFIILTIMGNLLSIATAMVTVCYYHSESRIASFCF